MTPAPTTDRRASSPSAASASGPAASYWLNPEPREEWDTDDSAMTSYQTSCAGAYEVRTLRQLADAIAAVV